MRLRQTFLAALCAATFAAPALADSQPASGTYEPTVGQSGKDVVWVPTPQALVDQMLNMAKLTPQDKLVDLGSGDGRTVITAAKRGSVARGIEYNPEMVELSKRAAQAEGVSDRATFEQADIFASDFSEADVITLFLLPQLNVRLRPTLLDMEPGTRIVSNSFTMENWEPDASEAVTEGCSGYCHAYLWIVPAKVEGKWQLNGKTLELEQEFQKLTGTLTDGGNSTAVADGRLDGAQIQFTVGSDQYVGQVAGDRIEGTVNGGGNWTATR